LIKATVKEH